MVLNSRYAMLFYALKRLVLLEHPERKSPHSQQIVDVNDVGTEAVLRKAGFAL